MNYIKLLNEYKKLYKENISLKKENNILKEKLGIISDTKIIETSQTTKPDSTCQINLTGQTDKHYNKYEIDKIVKTQPTNIVNKTSKPNKDEETDKNLIKENEIINFTILDSKISNQSSGEEKISFFVSLFKGRNDVYAKKWKSKKGNTGYSPVCLNEWDYVLFHKPKIKCSECKNKVYNCIDKNVIYNHLTGKIVVGIYPMFEDETCSFLAIDFDDDGWEKDIIILRDICFKKNIPVAVERSSSGNGAHLWFFFENNISAALARKFGTSLLTFAMSERSQIKFSSYDRLFPNQDTLPKGGLGNLIALPLQFHSRKKNNSVFIDENFNPYNDQWSYLSNIKKLKESEVEEHINDLTDGYDLGELRITETENDKPFKNNCKKVILSKSDFPLKIKIIKSNMIFINKKGLSNNVVNKIKRLAAFKNPDYYKNQAMRLPTYNKPRIISLSDETDNYLAVPRGCESDLLNLLNNFNIEIIIQDERYTGNKIDVEFNGELFEEQKEVVTEILKYDIGVLSATTAFGKTVIGAKLISERKVNTLILVHTRQLLMQWKTRLKEFLIINEQVLHSEASKQRKKIKDIIGILGAGKNNLNNIIDIAIMQSLVKGDEVKDIVKNYGMVIVDECHHVPAFSFEQILKNVRSKYVYGLTATPLRHDGHHPIIFMHCGSIKYKVDAKNQAEKRAFKHYIIPRFTPFRKPISQDESEWSISKIFLEISKSEIRNKLIIDDVVKCVKEKRNPIILTERTSHVETLAAELKEKVPNVITLTGSMSAKERKESLSILSREKNIVIVATGRFIGEGFDEPRLDTLFLAMPVAWKRY